MNEDTFLPSETLPQVNKGSSELNVISFHCLHCLVSDLPIFFEARCPTIQASPVMIHAVPDVSHLEAASAGPSVELAGVAEAAMVVTAEVSVTSPLVVTDTVVIKAQAMEVSATSL